MTQKRAYLEANRDRLEAISAKAQAKRHQMVVDGKTPEAAE
ncbi:hypothetical protein [Breoghania sp. L-A4]|nr:hypothetical protein [Breoghania sp. L-A4]